MRALLKTAIGNTRAARACRPLCVLAAVLAGCYSPAARPSPYLEAAAVEARSAQEAFLTGRFADAKISLREAVRLHLAAGDLPGAARSQLNLALAERADADRPAAAVAAERLRELTKGAVQQVGEREGARDDNARKVAELEAASGWLDALLALDNGDSALAMACVPLASVELASSSQMRGRIETLRADLEVRAGHFDRAVKLANEASVASESAIDLPELAHARSLEGAGHAGEGDWIGARGAYLKAVAIEEQTGAGERMAGDLRMLAMISQHLGDSAASRLYALRADAILSAKAARR